uniref:Uncharacterized protein n=1 Tax=Anguilla anguilla TaxID=7936 RepID=A0A0E9SHC9_ANGAN
MKLSIGFGNGQYQGHDLDVLNGSYGPAPDPHIEQQKCVRINV